MIIAHRALSKKARNILQLSLKIGITLFCCWYVSNKIDFSRLTEVLPKTNGWWLGGAVLAFIISKVLASFRLNIYFKHIGVDLSQRINLRLYWLGMFYNLFLPGSISGDAYKVIRLTQLYGIPYKRTTAAVVLDRFSGLLALGLLLAVSWVLLFDMKFYSWQMIAAACLSVPLFYWVIRYFFPYFIPAFWSTFIWGMLVQLLQVATMYCILKALQIDNSLFEYILIFLVSSVVAVLPFTIGGLGAREMVFLWGSSLFHLDNTVSIMASLLFYITTVLSSSLGFPYVFFDPLRQKNIKH
jgi:glycosyltransferase 2 family protein